MIYEILVPGNAQGKARPRMNTRTGRAYTPPKTKNYEYEIKQWFVHTYPQYETLQGRLKVTIVAYFSIPESTSKKKAEQMLQNEISPTKKPDIDNIVKAVLDSLNGLAYRDDTQVTILNVEKVYSDQPKVYVKIEEY